MNDLKIKTKKPVRKYCLYGLALTIIFSFGYFVIQAITFAIGMIVPVALVGLCVWCMIYLLFK